MGRFHVVLVITMAAALLSACEGLSRAQFMLPEATTADRERIKVLVSGFAQEQGFTEEPKESLIPGAFQTRSQPRWFPVSLCAGMVEQDAVIHMQVFHGVPPATPGYFREMATCLEHSLRSEFGERLERLEYPDQFQFLARDGERVIVRYGEVVSGP